MPNDLMALDQELPRFTGHESLEQRVQMLQDYQYQLLELLRYMLRNLDIRNFNQTELGRFIGTITDPINARIGDAEGNLTKLTVTAQGITSRVSDAEGNISTLQQRADGFQTTVTNQAGQISALQQRADGFQATVTNQAGQISTLQQRADGFQTTVANQAREMSAIRQSVDSIELGVSNGETSSTISLYRDGVQVSSKNIRFVGLVSYEDLLEEGRTTICGGNIDTDTLTLDTLYGDSIFLKDSSGRICTEFRISGASSATDALDLWARGIRLNSWPGYIYLNADDTDLQIGGGELHAGGDLIPRAAGRYLCGSSRFPWQDVYSQDGTISSSDRDGKFDIDYDMSRYSPLFDALRPCSFRRKNGDSYRAHTGLIAQEVDGAREAAGLPESELAAFCRWGEGDETHCGLRYEELIAILIYEVQALKKEAAKRRAQAARA